LIDRVTVVGTGMWGTTLSILLARKGLTVTLWTRTSEEALRLGAEGENSRVLPGIPFPQDLIITDSLSAASDNCGLLLLVVPSQTMRENVRRLLGHLPQGTIVASAAKGLEANTHLRMSQVILDEIEISGRSNISVAVVSGPNLAREIALGHPATTVVASPDIHVATAVQQALMTQSFRVYTNSDVVGAELGGALKNIIALGAGMGDGLDVGENAKAAFITRGLAEMGRLGLAMGAHPLTFAGLAGLGDLIATCASRQSRNRHVGEELAKGRSLGDIQRSMVSVAEGVPTTVVARELARQQDVEMPITNMMYQVLFEGKPPRDAINELMTREPRSEASG
jgi:glycerol-3-phosphate dehydrogenase (NAD(P)+)